MFDHLVKFWEVGWAENFSSSPDDELKRTGEYKKKCTKIKKHLVHNSLVMKY